MGYNKNKGLPSKTENFSEWYNQVIVDAELIDKRYNVKGMFVWMSEGFELIRNIKEYWDKIYKEDGIKEMYFPLLVPLEYAKQNASWFEGFKEEAFYVKGINEPEFNTILRPTGEPAMYPMFSTWIRSYQNLPFRIYETVSSFRYETKHTRPLIRDREITNWYEIHTVHETKEEAFAEIQNAIKLNEQIYDYLALSPIKVEKPLWEVFPGAIGSTEFYTIMPNGRAMENGSCNNLGQAYAKKFDIMFTDKNGEEKYAWQTCTGNGARFLVAALAQHGDDFGLVLPPNIAPTKVVIVPIIFSDKEEIVLSKAKEIKSTLESNEISCVLDVTDKKPGEKFYYWETKGIPIRIEVGPKDIEKDSYPLFRRDTKEKLSVKLNDLSKKVKFHLESMQENLSEKAKQFTKSMIVDCDNLEKLGKLIEDKKVARVYCKTTQEVYEKIAEIGEGVELFGYIPEETTTLGKCIVTSEETRKQGYVGKTY